MDERVPILMYHKIAKRDPKAKVPGHYVSPGMFRRQMAGLKALGFQSAPLSTLFKSPTQRKSVVLSFDDGYQNFLTNAVPAMKAYGFTGTVFLVSNQLGGTNAWDVRDLGDVEERLMTVEEILAAHAEGHEFGSHTADHTHLDQQSEDDAWKQISTSREQLKSALNIPIETFCYPYGGKSVSVMQMVEKAGYVNACSTEKGANTSKTNRYALKRMNVRSDTVLPVFLMKLYRELRNG